MSSWLVVTAKGARPETRWTSGLENCHSLFISPDEKHVAFIAELNGTVVMASSPQGRLMARGQISREHAEALNEGNPATFEPRLSPELRLVRAAYNRDIAQVRELLAKGANPDGKDDSGSTALMVFVNRNDVKGTKLLLEHGADANAKSNRGVTCLMRARDMRVARLLLENGAGVSVADLRVETALSHAAEHGDVEFVALLLKKGASPNTHNLPDTHNSSFLNPPVKSAYGRTPLMNATNFGHSEVVRLLLRAAADVNARDSNGSTALSLAIKYKHPEIAHMLKHTNAKQYALRIPQRPTAPQDDARRHMLE